MVKALLQSRIVVNTRNNGFSYCWATDQLCTLWYAVIYRHVIQFPSNAESVPLWRVAAAVDRICIVGNINMAVYDTMNTFSVHDHQVQLIDVRKHCSEKIQQPAIIIPIIPIIPIIILLFFEIIAIKFSQILTSNGDTNFIIIIDLLLACNASNLNIICK